MTGTWPRRLAYRTGSTMSPRARRCPLPPSPNTFLTTTNPVPARATHSRIPRHTHGRTLPPVPTLESDLTTTESIQVIGRVLTRNPVRDHMQQGPIPSPSPHTPVPIHMLYTIPRHLCPSHFHSQFPTYIQRRVVHGRFPTSRIKLCITLTTHRVGGPHTSWEHPSWEVFPHRYGCRTQCVSLIPFSPSEWRSADDIFSSLLSFVFAGHADETVPTAAQAPVHEFRTLGIFLFGFLAKIQAPTNKEAPEEE